MEAINLKFDIQKKRIEVIQREATEEYLKRASKMELQRKIDEVDDATKKYIEIWERTNPDDFEENQSVGWEGLKEGIREYRDLVKTPLVTRMGEIDEADKEKKGEDVQPEAGPSQEQKPVAPQPTENAKLVELERLYNAYKREYHGLSKALSGKGEDQVKEKRTELQIMHGNFVGKYLGYQLDDDPRLTTAEKTAWKVKREEVNSMANDMTTRFAEKLELIQLQHNSQLQQETIREKDEKALAAEKRKGDADQIARVEREARETAQAEKEAAQKLREAAQKDRDEAVKRLEELVKQLEGMRTQNQKEKKKTKKDEDARKLQEELERERIQTEEAEKTTASTSKLIKDLEKRISETVIVISDSEDEDEPKVGAQGGSEHANPTGELNPMVGKPSGSKGKADPVVQLKIDQVEIPYFSGNQEEWISFKEFFQVLVHRNETLSDLLKLNILRSHLSGEALATIKGYDSLNLNYSSAWDDLKRRYDRTEEKAHAIIKKFIETPAILHRSNTPRLRMLIDGTNQMLRSLPNLNIQVDTWDPIITLILYMKLDDVTRYDWKQKLGRRQMTKVTEMLEFLESRARELQPSQGDKLSDLLKGDHRQPRTRGPRIFQINENKREAKTPIPKSPKQEGCTICNGQHSFWKCKKLLNECAKVRTEMLRSLKLCFRCLMKHQLGECESSDCPYCGGAHNILLCYKKENDENRNRKDKDGAVGGIKRKQYPNQKKPDPKSNPVNPTKPSNQTIRDWSKEDWNDEEEEISKNGSSGKN